MRLSAAVPFMEHAMLSIRTILHPTDFSEHSADAFRLACLLARDHKAKLVLLHVAAPPVTVTSGVMTPAPPEPSEYDRPALQAKLDAVVPTDPAVLVERRLVFGVPSQEIVAAAQHGCDLIVMGTHGRRGFSRLVLGSVAEQVIRKAPCPVLAVKLPASGAHKPQIRRILHPTDFSEHSAVALHLASWLAREYKAPLTALHVLQAPAAAFGDVMLEFPTETERANASRQLAALTPTVPGVQFETQTEEGDAAQQILTAAESMPADLIVMGTHGRTGLGRLLLGSAAERVLREAPCAVLTVKTPLPATGGDHGSSS
ncbi:MAG: universal stress protein [Gemmataceae bacterium]|nr:universal stress protein [Gemmataceae bacterium]